MDRDYQVWRSWLSRNKLIRWYRWYGDDKVFLTFHDNASLIERDLRHWTMMTPPSVSTVHCSPLSTAIHCHPAHCTLGRKRAKNRINHRLYYYTYSSLVYIVAFSYQFTTVQTVHWHCPPCKSAVVMVTSWQPLCSVNIETVYLLHSVLQSLWHESYRYPFIGLRLHTVSHCWTTSTACVSKIYPTTYILWTQIICAFQLIRFVQCY